MHAGFFGQQVPLLPQKTVCMDLKPEVSHTFVSHPNRVKDGLTRPSDGPDSQQVTVCTKFFVEKDFMYTNIKLF